MKHLAYLVAVGFIFLAQTRALLAQSGSITIDIQSVESLNQNTVRVIYSTTSSGIAWIESGWLIKHNGDIISSQNYGFDLSAGQHSEDIGVSIADGYYSFGIHVWGEDSWEHPIDAFVWLGFAHMPAGVIPTFQDNFIMSEAVMVPIDDDGQIWNLQDHEIARSISYADDMGRKSQTYAVKASPLGKDVISYSEYDEYGRQSKQYLPFVSTADNGSYRVYAKNELLSFYTQTGRGYDTTTFPFALTKFENSPLNRVLEQGSPGVTWQPHAADFDGHTTKSWQRANTSSEVVKWGSSATFDGYYAAGEILVTKMIDENGDSSLSYSDKSGKTILKKSFNNSQEILTYYVYDDMGNLKFIIPPMACASISGNWTITAEVWSKWITAFWYDGQNRLIEKRIPEAGAVFTVYDQMGRVVATQDSLLRLQNKWMFTKYDVQGRPILTGLYTDVSHTSRSAMQSYADGFIGANLYESRTSANYATQFGYTTQAFPPIAQCEVWTVTYYDDYDFDRNPATNDVAFVNDSEFQPTSFGGNAAFHRLKGKVTGTKTLVKDPLPATINYSEGKLTISGEYTSPAEATFDVADSNQYKAGPQYLTSVPFYDKYGRVIQTQSNNSLGGTDVSNTEYDFPGKVLKTKTIHQTVSASVTVRKRFEYDHAGRLLKTYQQNNADSEILLSSLAYNELGQLIEKNLHSTNGGSTFLQSVDMRYNIRGWLKSINNRHLDVADNNDDTNDLFGMEFNYDASDAGLNSVAQYNGNISDIRWKTRPTMVENAYGYQYDKLNQLISARYATWGSGSWSTDNKYSTNSITYDLNGNILSMSQNWNGALADNLTYVNYGNKLVGVDDAITDSPVTNDFEDHSASALPDPNNPASWEYLYDGNGNMIQDKNKGITNIEYNYLNLPTKVTFTGNKTIEWVYAVSGAKLRKTVTDNGTVVKTIDYVSGFVYENSTMSFFFMEAGRVKKTQSGSLQYEYDLKDHLGNTRLSFTDANSDGNAEVLRESHYYAFGMRIEGLGTTSDNKFLFNGKELTDDFGLNWYEYGWRMYDPQLGRWHAMDPVDEFNSPYCYVGNNPINVVDPDGRFATSASNWVGDNLPGLIAAPLAGALDFLTGLGNFVIGAATFNAGKMGSGLKDAGLGALSSIGLKEAFTEKWVRGATGGFLPQSLSEKMTDVVSKVPKDAAANGMHAWHAGTNAVLTHQLGPVGAVFVAIGGLFHESPLDWGSFRAEQYYQGTVNHILDSFTDIAANAFGMTMGLLLPNNWAVTSSIGAGNHIPGPGEPDPAFGGNGKYRAGHPSDAWGQYPK